MHSTRRATQPRLISQSQTVSSQSMINKLINEDKFLQLNKVILETNDFNQKFWENVAEKLIARNLIDAQNDDLIACILNLFEKSPAFSSISNISLLHVIVLTFEDNQGVKTLRFLKDFFSKYKVNFQIASQVNYLTRLMNFQYEHAEKIEIFQLLFTNGAFTRELRDAWGHQQTETNEVFTLYERLMILNEIELINWIDSQLSSPSKAGQTTAKQSVHQDDQLSGLNLYKKKVSIFLSNSNFSAIEDALRLRKNFDPERMHYSIKQLDQHDLELLRRVICTLDQECSEEDAIQRIKCTGLLMRGISQEKLLKLSEDDVWRLYKFLMYECQFDFILQYLKNPNINRSSYVLDLLKDSIDFLIKDKETNLERLAIMAEIATAVESLKEQEAKMQTAIKAKIQKLMIDGNYGELVRMITRVRNVTQYVDANDFIKELHARYKKVEDVETCRQIVSCMKQMLYRNKYVIGATDEATHIFEICVQDCNKTDMKEVFQLLSSFRKIPLDSKSIEEIYANLPQAFSTHTKYVCKCLTILWSQGGEERVSQVIEEIQKKDVEVRKDVNRRNFVTRFLDIALSKKRYDIMAFTLKYHEPKSNDMELLYKEYGSASPQDQQNLRTCLYQLFSKGCRYPEANDLMAAILIEAYEPQSFDQVSEFLHTSKPNLNVDLGNSEDSLLPLALAVRKPLDLDEKLKLINLLLNAGALVDYVEAKTKKTAYAIAQEEGITAPEILGKLQPTQNPIFSRSKFKFWSKQGDLNQLQGVLQDPLRVQEAKEYEKNAQLKTSLLMLSVTKGDLDTFTLLIDNGILPSEIIIQEIFKYLIEKECHLNERYDYEKHHDKFWVAYNMISQLFSLNADPKKLETSLHVRLIWFAVANFDYQLLLDNELLNDLFDQMPFNLYVVPMDLQVEKQPNIAKVLGMKKKKALSLYKLSALAEKTTLFNWLLTKVEGLPCENEVTPLIVKYGEKHLKKLKASAQTQSKPSKTRALEAPTSSVPTLSFAAFLNERLHTLEGILEIHDLGENRIHLCFQNEKAYKNARARFLSNPARYKLIHGDKEESENTVYSLTVTIEKELTLKNMHGFISYWQTLNVKETYIQDFIHEAETQKNAQPRNRPKVDRRKEVDENRVANIKAKQQAKQKQKPHKREKEEGKVKEKETDPTFIPVEAKPSPEPVGTVELYPFGITDQSTSSSTSVSQRSLTTANELAEQAIFLKKRIVQSIDCLKKYKKLRAHPERIQDQATRLCALSQYLMQACEAAYPTGKKKTGLSLLKTALDQNVMSAYVFKQIRHTLRSNITLKEDDLEQLFSRFDQLNVKTSLDHLRIALKRVKNQLPETSEETLFAYLDRNLIKEVDAQQIKAFKSCEYIQSLHSNDFPTDQLFHFIVKQSLLLKSMKQDLNVNGNISKWTFAKDKRDYHAAMRKIISDLQKAIVILEKRFPQMRQNSNDTIKWIKAKGSVNAHVAPQRLPQGRVRIRVSPWELFLTWMPTETAFEELNGWIEHIKDFCVQSKSV